MILKYSLGLCFQAAVVLCMDVGFTMNNSFPGEESPFEQAKKVITMFVQRQVSVRLALSLKLLITSNTRCPASVFGNLKSFLTYAPVQVQLSLEPDAFFFSWFWPLHWVLQFLPETRGNVTSCLKVQSLEPDGMGLDPCSAMSFTELMLLNQSFSCLSYPGYRLLITYYPKS